MLHSLVLLKLESFFYWKVTKRYLTDCVESVERPRNMTRNHSSGCALFALVNTISWFWIEPCNLIFDERFLQSLKYYVPLPCGQNTFFLLLKLYSVERFLQFLSNNSQSVSHIKSTLYKIDAFNIESETILIDSWSIREHSINKSTNLYTY